MQVPAFLFGRFRDVKAACNRRVMQLERGASWEELCDEVVDTSEFECLLVVDGPGVLTGGEENFNFFAITQAIGSAIPKRLPEKTLVTLLEPMLATRWGFLALLGQWAYPFLFVHPGAQVEFLHAAAQWWDELVAEGPRYSKGANAGDHLWKLPTNLQRCLAREGLPQGLLWRPIPPGGIAELIALTRAGSSPTETDELH